MGNVWLGFFYPGGTPISTIRMIWYWRLYQVLRRRHHSVSLQAVLDDCLNDCRVRSIPSYVLSRYLCPA